jgi:hypothetical protein
VSWWEVDHPDTQADKRARLERLGIAGGRIDESKRAVIVQDIQRRSTAYRRR